ncbi:arylsulfatase K isoform X2 [Electrophorus electricus]|uniref:arylsulfatase K isoform X2 n=1 Tax=Electrophorus electricus TaxID=8005 RepID=UPI0015CF947B|nr:arylsulfatase K isoform X2 [Electrophorus electricus]
MNTVRLFVFQLFHLQTLSLYLYNTANQRPNIVMIMCDAFDGRLSFNSGTKVVQLPFIAYVRQMGAVFLNSYTNSPICCPSRAAMWSGRWVHLTQAWNNYKCLPPNATTWMDHLQKNGYHTHSMGKLDYTSGGHSVSNRVEAWTREVPFLLRQEGRPMTELVSLEHISVPRWLPFSEMHPVDYYSTVTKNCSGNFTEQEIRHIRAFYYAMCAETDAMLGEVIGTLRETGLLNSTVVVFTSDHGDLAMEHRQFYKMSMFEGSSHVPLLMMGPRIKTGVEIRSPVSLVDLYPSFIDFAGVRIPDGLSGHSLVPLVSRAGQSASEPHPGWVLSEYHGCNANASTYMLRIGQWKYITYSDGVSVPPQLFDLSKDATELKDLASHYPGVCQHLDKLLRSVVDYPRVSQAVQRYNKQQFLVWKQSLGNNYTQVIGSLRWHMDWQKNAQYNEKVIEDWLTGLD